MPKNRQRQKTDRSGTIGSPDEFTTRAHGASPAERTARIRTELVGAMPRFSIPTPAQRSAAAKKAAKDRWK